MKSHRRLSLLAVGAIASAAAVAAAFALTSGASATGTPFTALPAVGNVHALNAPAVFAPPAQVESLPADMRPAAGTVHALGSSGYGWVLNGALCIQMNNIGPGGCLTQFTKPVTLYLWGDSTGFNAGGVVPDEVVGLTLDHVERRCARYARQQRIQCGSACEYIDHRRESDPRHRADVHKRRSRVVAARLTAKSGEESGAARPMSRPTALRRQTFSIFGTSQAHATAARADPRHRYPGGLLEVHWRSLRFRSCVLAFGRPAKRRFYDFLKSKLPGLEGALPGALSRRETAPQLPDHCPVAHHRERACPKSAPRSTYLYGGRPLDARVLPAP